MYIPSHNLELDRSRILRLMREHPFATLISSDPRSPSSEPFLSHFPLLASESTSSGGSIRIEGHMSRQNPQWQHFAAGAVAVAVFHGPHAYITPVWYEEDDVPTWNYAVVHARGDVRIIDDAPGMLKILAAVVNRFEGTPSESRWKFRLPEDLARAEVLGASIVGFEITVTAIEAKFKLSQNRSAEDRRRVIAGLKARGDDESLGVARWMELA